MFWQALIVVCTDICGPGHISSVVKPMAPIIERRPVSVIENKVEQLEKDSRLNNSKIQRSLSVPMRDKVYSRDLSLSISFNRNESSPIPNVYPLQKLQIVPIKIMKGGSCIHAPPDLDLKAHSWNSRGSQQKSAGVTFSSAIHTPSFPLFLVPKDILCRLYIKNKNKNEHFIAWKHIIRVENNRNVAHHRYNSYNFFLVRQIGSFNHHYFASYTIDSALIITGSSLIKQYKTEPFTRNYNTMRLDKPEMAYAANFAYFIT